MHITNVKTFNKFAGLNQMDVKISKLTVVIGGNGAGKTLFLWLFDYISAASTGNLGRTFECLGGFQRVVPEQKGFRIEVDTTPVFEDRDLVKDALKYSLQVGATAKNKTLERTHFRIEEEGLANYYRVSTGERDDPLKFIERRGTHAKVLGENGLVSFDQQPVGTGLALAAEHKPPYSALITKFAKKFAGIQLISGISLHFRANYGTDTLFTQAVDAFLSKAERNYESLLYEGSPLNSDILLRQKDGSTLRLQDASNGFQALVSYVVNITDRESKILLLDNIDECVGLGYLAALHTLIVANPQHQYIITSRNSLVASEFHEAAVIAASGGSFENIPDFAVDEWMDSYDSGDEWPTLSVDEEDDDVETPIDGNTIPVIVGG